MWLEIKYHDNDYWRSLQRAAEQTREAILWFAGHKIYEADNEYQEAKQIAEYIKTEFFDTGLLLTYLQRAFTIERQYQEMSGLAHKRKPFSDPGTVHIPYDDYFDIKIFYHDNNDFAANDNNDASIALNLGTGEVDSF